MDLWAMQIFYSIKNLVHIIIGRDFRITNMQHTKTIVDLWFYDTSSTEQILRDIHKYWITTTTTTYAFFANAFLVSVKNVSVVTSDLRTVAIVIIVRNCI